jgi:cell division protein FtsZ
LYEVDEAATRIREEVDQDANIIVGATFDETLEGIIRVSVVATGIDQPAVARPLSAPEVRIAELTQRLRSAEQQSAATERAERKENRGLSAGTGSTAGQPIPEAIEKAAKAAVAAAVLPLVEDVTIRPMPRKPSLFPEQPAIPAEPPIPDAFIPPAPEPGPNRPPRRMPDIEDLPRPGQAELRAQRRETSEEEPAERRKGGGLLRRLAAVGLGRREEGDGAEKAPASPRPTRPGPRPADRMPAAPPRLTMPAPRAPEPVSEYAKRPPHQALDSLGRQAPVHNIPEEDQLEIPAFLRRQAN